MLQKFRTITPFSSSKAYSARRPNVRVAGVKRRHALANITTLTGVAIFLTTPLSSFADSEASRRLEDAAFEAYAGQDFKETVRLLSNLINFEPTPSPRWLEMRAQVLVDQKDFEAAIKDYDAAIEYAPASELVILARLWAGRSLAYEGISEWDAALQGYDKALALAEEAGVGPDPYIYNSRGNCLNSLERWEDARESYLISSEIFQTAKGFRGRNGNTTSRLDGAIFSASNAALMLAQMGDLSKATKEMERIARRAPGSADMRAALAALYYDKGLRERAEDEWNFACDMLVVGCKKYQDRDWLSRIRRWPPVMVEKMFKFIDLKPPEV
ncbi:hypothetical protein CEUSTIGMA_g9487.t1 [Chlamydomonas eustigma]|uniref:Uncharacterized protein n=1 Tax=Chlamydomonas eustigma TaxID=1157962 RepID=A0A250XGM5_9CHLO|nr:hypothetical protein CEUSTIGMA_g9487.t1 [Chlamydomonas eustigma]|eukprot:GAX82059.1 hypothetical protein CEUSTIGMA_g9487.t1 [Chlamydomonas eustigma]